MLILLLVQCAGKLQQVLSKIAKQSYSPALLAPLGGGSKIASNLGPKGNLVGQQVGQDDQDCKIASGRPRLQDRQWPTKIARFTL